MDPFGQQEGRAGAFSRRASRTPSPAADRPCCGLPKAEKPGLTMADEREGRDHDHRHGDASGRSRYSGDMWRRGAPGSRRAHRRAGGADLGRHLRAAGHAARLRRARRLEQRVQLLRTLAVLARGARPGRGARKGACGARARRVAAARRRHAPRRGLLFQGSRPHPHRHARQRAGPAGLRACGHGRSRREAGARHAARRWHRGGK